MRFDTYMAKKFKVLVPDAGTDARTKGRGSRNEINSGGQLLLRGAG